MSTASNMCTLYCALIVCTLVSTAITTNTNTVGSNGRTFDSREVTTEENFTNRRKMLTTTTTPIAKGKYVLTTTQSTLSGTDSNDTMLGDEVKLNFSEEVIDDRQQPENNKNSSEEPISTNDQAQTTLKELPTRRKTLTTTTTPIAKGKYVLTTTQGTLSGTDLNDTMLGDEVNLNLSEKVIDDPQEPENNKNSSEEPISTNDQAQTTLKELPTRMASTARTKTAKDPNVFEMSSAEYDIIEKLFLAAFPSTTSIGIRKGESTTTSIGNRSKHSKPMRRKTEWFDSSTPFIFFNSERPTIRYYEPTEWIKPTNKNCKCGKRHLKGCHDKEKATTTTTIFELLSEKKRWDQEQHMSETTMSDVEEQLEKSKKWKLQQKILEMESDRLKTIFDILNSQ